MQRLIYVIGLLFLLGRPVLSVADDGVLLFPSQKYATQFSALRDTETLSKIGDLVRAIDPAFMFVAKECGVINAWYSPQSKTITVCYELLHDGDLFVDSQYNRENPATQAWMKSGIFFWVLFHELGHAIIHLKAVPIIGGEEDAADRIATILLLEFAKNNPVEGKVMLVGDLAYTWSRRSDILDKLLSGRQMYANEHPMNEQRVFNIICLAYGSNPALFVDTARQLKLPSERAVRCQREYIQTNAAVKELLN